MPKWTFYDPIVPETYTFEINPNDGGSPSHDKTITYQNTSAPNGKTLIFEGRDQALSMQFSGTVLSQAQYTAMIAWFGKRHQIMLTDDLGRQFWIYITQFQPKRERAVHSLWKHSYTVQATILDYP